MKRSGFTLLELVMVVAVLAALVALLLPVLARARDRARQATCLSNLRQVEMAYQLYVRDWDEQLADYALYTWGPGGKGTREKPYWRWAGPPLTLAAVRRPWETAHAMDGGTTPRWTWGRVPPQNDRHEPQGLEFVDEQTRLAFAYLRDLLVAEGACTGRGAPGAR